MNVFLLSVRCFLSFTGQIINRPHICTLSPSANTVKLGGSLKLKYTPLGPALVITSGQCYPTDR